MNEGNIQNSVSLFNILMGLVVKSCAKWRPAVDLRSLNKIYFFLMLSHASSLGYFA